MGFRPSYGTEWRMTDVLTIPVAEEADIDRELQLAMVKLVDGSQNDGDRRAYKRLVMRRTKLVQQMAMPIRSSYWDIARR